MSDLKNVGIKYTPLTKKAMQICFKAHKDQLDKGGLPYVFHPFHLAEQMDTEAEICTALLHDVVEDTGCTLDDLRAEGFTEEIISAVSHMTHEKGTPYLDYVRAMRSDPIARKVKLADLKHNSTLERLDQPAEKDLKRREKYLKAMDILMGNAT